jgi:hypothetical protein
MFLLAFLKTLTKSKDCSESRVRIFVPAFLLYHWSIFSRVLCTTRTMYMSRPPALGTIFRIKGSFQDNF